METVADSALTPSRWHAGSPGSLELACSPPASDGVRHDIASRELAAYCLYALAAATALPIEAAVRRLVTVTLDGLRPPR